MTTIHRHREEPVSQALRRMEPSRNSISSVPLREARSLGFGFVRWSFLAAVALVSVTDWRLPGNLTLSDALFGITILASSSMWRRRPWLPASPTLRLGLTFVLLPGTLVSLATQDILGMELALRAGMAVGLPLVAAGAYARSAKQTGRLLSDGITAYAAGALVWMSLHLSGVSSEPNLNRGFSGPTDHPTSAGIFLSIAFMAATSGLLIMRGRARVVAALCLLASAYGLAINGSRSSAIAVVCGAGLVSASAASANSRRTRRVAGLIGIAACAAIFVSWQTGTIQNTQLWKRTFNSSSYDQASTATREGVFVEGWSQFLERPITGVGFADNRSSHSVIVQFLKTSGALGGIGYLLIIGSLVTSVRRFRKQLRGPLGWSLTAIALLTAVNTQSWDRYVWTLPALISVLGASARLTGPSRTGRRPVRYVSYGGTPAGAGGRPDLSRISDHSIRPADWSTWTAGGPVIVSVGLSTEPDRPKGIERPRPSNIYLVASQIFTSLTNAAFGVLLARTLSIENLGFAGILITLLSVGLGLCRYALLDPYVAHVGSSERSETISAVAFFTVVTFLVLATASSFAPTAMRVWAFVFVVGAVVVSYEDALRYLAFVVRPHVSAIGDVAWFGAFVVPLGVLGTIGVQISAPMVLGAYIFGALAGLVVVNTQMRADLIPTREGFARSWTNRGQIVPPALDYCGNAASQVVLLPVVATVAGLEAAGVARALALCLGPAIVLVQATNLIALSRIRGASTTSEAIHRKGVLISSMAGGLAVVLLGAALKLTPTSALAQVVGVEATAPLRGLWLLVIVGGALTPLTLAPWTIARLANPRGAAVIRTAGSVFGMLIAITLAKRAGVRALLYSQIVGQSLVNGWVLRQLVAHPNRSLGASAKLLSQVEDRHNEPSSSVG